MDDLDEGIGSNESNQSNKDSANIIDDLKCLNNSSIISKESNVFSQNLSGKLNSNGLLKYCDNIPETNKVQNDNGENDSDSQSNSNDNDAEKLGNEDKMDNKSIEEVESAENIPNNDGVKDEIETTNSVKQESSESDADKSSFHIPLDEKLRNSLKGLVAKVKSSEILKDSANPVNSSDMEDTKSGITLKDEQESDKVNKNIKNPDEQKTKDSYDALLLETGDDDDDDTDGIFMDMGSDCEEYENALLSSGSENLDEKPRNINSGISESHEGKNKYEEKEDSKIKPECPKSIPVENTIDIKELKNAAHVEVKNEGECTDSVNDNLAKSDNSSDIDQFSDSVNDTLAKSENSSDIEEKSDTGLDNNSDKSTSAKEIHDSLKLHTDDNSEINEPLVLKSIESKVNVDEEVPMEMSGLSVESQNKSHDIVSDKLQSISDKVATDKMLAENKSVEAKASVMEEDNDVIFQKITKITDSVVCETNGPTFERDDKLPDLEGANANILSLEEDNDVIFEKVTTAEGVNLENKCDNVGTDKISAAVKKQNDCVKAEDPLLNGSKHDMNEIEAMDAQDTIVSSSSDRKRAAECNELCANDNKRKKLSLANGIGKHESQEEPTSIELSDSDDEEISVSNGKMPITVENIDEPTAKTSPKCVTITEEELDSLVREKVKVYLASQQNSLIAKLTHKVKELQTNNDLWKRQVKDLQVKVNEVTVLQQKLEKRKAATNALRQIRTRHVAVQVDNGKTSSSKVAKQVATPPRAAVSVPMVTSPAGTGTIRLPIPQSSYGTSTLPTQMTPGTKLITTAYKTPSVKSLLDTTKVQKTVGSVLTTPTTVTNSVIGLVQYPNFLSKTITSQGYATLAQALVTQVSALTTNVTKTATKTITLTSPTAKVIDLTEDDDSKNQTRFLAFPPGVNPGVRTMLPPGTQLVRSGIQQNAPTYQVVFSPPSAGIRPGTVSVASALSQTPVLTGMQGIQQVQIQASQQQQQSITPGTTMARAAVPALPASVPQQPVRNHPAPFPIITYKQQTAGLKAMPPKPSLSISRVSQGIVLSWNMSLTDSHSKINNYQLFAYQETSAQPVSTLWKKVGDVKALPLPMACTLTQFQVGNKYHFAVRAMDEHNREGSFSDPGSIHLTPSATLPSK